MKRIFSVILLFSLWVGIMQPVLPMIEYQLFEGSIMELLDSNPEGSEASCTVAHSLLVSDCSNCGSEADSKLLDTDYYPITLKIGTAPNPRAFLNGSIINLPHIGSLTDPTFLPKFPPPRSSRALS